MKKLWCSGATDTTGAALAEALGFELVKSKPALPGNGPHIVIGWGSKTERDVTLNRAATILNHPNAIRKNRNKFEALKMMVADRNLSSNIAKFCGSTEIISKLNNRRNGMILPVVGRTNFHQSGKGFWLCLTKSHVDKAISDGAQYFQEYMDIKAEYRIHVMFDKIVYAVKKVENPSVEGWINQRKEKINTYAEKNNVDLNGDTMEYTLKILAKEVILPDRIVRSNRRGWKFSGVTLNNLSARLKDAAIRSVKVMGLDFGAVDCAVLNDGGASIIEINSGPGLQMTALERYVEAFRTKIDEIERPANVRANARPARQHAAAAAGSVEESLADRIDGEGMVVVMNNVRTNAEARAVINNLMGRRTQN